MDSLPALLPEEMGSYKGVIHLEGGVGGGDAGTSHRAVFFGGGGHRNKLPSYGKVHPSNNCHKKICF